MEHENKGNKPQVSFLSKENDYDTERKDRINHLKQEHDKTFVVIEKPEDMLKRILSERKISNSKTEIDNEQRLDYQTNNLLTMEIDVWSFEKYHYSEGLIVGIWPKGSFNYPDNLYWQYNQNILSLLKNTYGFYKIGLERAAISANTIYQPNEILALIDGCYPTSVIQSYSDYTGSPLWGCYTDEPFSRQNNPMPSGAYARYTLNTTKTWWKQKFGQNSIFVVGETTTSYAAEISSVVDYVNCSWYGYYFWPLTNDQRSRWTDFNNQFGYMFNHLWISGELDMGEMNQLIGHAQNMGKNSIWLYAAELGMSDQSYWESIYEFCYYSFTHGYLRREERRYIYVYTYNGIGELYEITSWDLTDIIDTSETRILSN